MTTSSAFRFPRWYGLKKLSSECHFHVLITAQSEGWCLIQRPSYCNCHNTICYSQGIHPCNIWDSRSPRRIDNRAINQIMSRTWKASLIPWLPSRWYLGVVRKPRLGLPFHWKHNYTNRLPPAALSSPANMAIKHRENTFQQPLCRDFYHFVRTPVNIKDDY